MIRFKSSFILILTLVVIVSSQNVKSDESSEGFFTVVGSNLLKLKEQYRVSVAYQGYKQEKVLQIGIKNSQTNKTNTKDVTFSGDGVKFVDFDVSLLEFEEFFGCTSKSGIEILLIS